MKIKIAAVLLLSVMIPLSVFEVYLRIYDPQNLREEADGKYMRWGKFFRPRPGVELKVSKPETKMTWKINSKGLRDNEIPYTKPEGLYRIMGLGDSFMFGFGVEQEDTFLHKLEGMLNKNADLYKEIDRFETVNMGVGSYGTISELNILQKEGLKYQPDMIILAIWVGNDVYDTLREYQAIISSANVTGTSKPGVEYYVKKFLGSHLHTYSFFSIRCNQLLIKAKLRPIDYESMAILQKHSDEKTDAGWKLLERYVLKMADLAKENSSQFLVVMIPMRHQVNPGEWSDICSVYDLDKEDYDLDKPQKRLMSFCEKNGIHYIDLLRGFKDSYISLYYKTDPHLTKRGHASAALIMYDYIQKVI